MNEIQEIRTLEVVAAEIRAFTASMLGNIIEIGRRLCEAKEMLPYGEFGAWVETNTGYGKSTANNFMRLFEEYGSKQNSLFGAEVEDVQTFGKLSYSKALALLALPSGEREEFVEAHDVEAMTTRELQQAIRERDEAIKQAEAARRDAEGMEQMMRESAEHERLMQLKLTETKQAFSESQERLEAELMNIQKQESVIFDLEKQVRELESRPVEVAVQEPDPEAVEKAVAAAVAEAGEKHRSELEKLRKKLESAEKARDKAKDEAKKAGEKAESAGKAEADKLRSEQQSAQAEAARYKAEAEELRKQLAMSGEAVTSFKLHFSAWQRAYADMSDALERADEETAGKLRAAVAAQIRGWSET